MAKVWKARTTEPALNNLYYITTSGGGYNTCIQGNSSGNREKNRQTTYSVLPNCCGYAQGRVKEIASCPDLDVPNCNAEDWNDMSNWERGSTPKLGAIACWRSGRNWNGSDGCGHVAVVEEIYSDGSYLVSESGWSSFYFRTHKLYADNYYGSGLTFECFLYNPKADNNYEEQETSPYLTEKGYIGYGDKCPQVDEIAQFMYRVFPAYTSKKALGDYYGYYIGESIKEFQRRLVGQFGLVESDVDGYGRLVGQFGLVESDVDGYVGAKTLKALESFGFTHD